MRILLSITLVLLLFTACSTIEINQKGYVQDRTYAQDSNVVLVSEVKWQQLNPKRGDKSPKAADLWGARAEAGPTGFLVKFVDGFTSPPHIHNVSYRGVVIDGLIHNDDPSAADMWMPAGSFWTQPAGEVHITSCKGGCLAYIEIEDGPYLVHPSKEAFDNGERPVNIDKSNLVWLQTAADSSVKNPEVTYLWGSTKKGQLGGKMLKLPPGFDWELENETSGLQVVVIEGELGCVLPGGRSVNDIKPGSYLSLQGDNRYQVSCQSGEDCILYVRNKIL